MFSLSNATSVLDVARGYFKNHAPVDEAPAVAEQPMMDRSRYERLLEHELDRQHLTAVEREDSEMLDRVRAALYED